MAVNVNRVVLTGNLTHAPELASIPQGASRCRLRIAVNGRRKDGERWVERPHYVRVTAWGVVAENCAKYLEKGRPVAIDGRLEWHEWQTEDGKRREALEVVAEQVQFLGPRPAPAPETPPASEGSEAPEQEPALAGVGAAPAPGTPEPTEQEDIPF